MTGAILPVYAGEQSITDLTERQRQVAELAAQGLGTKQISQRLYISPNTVKRHMEAILEKTGLPSRAAIGLWLADQQVAQ